MANASAGLSGGLSGAATGAQIGTMFAPGIGTAIGAAAGGVLGLASGLFGGGGDDAGEEMQRKQLELQQQDLDFRRSMYNYERSMTDPIRKQLTSEALSGTPLDYAMNAAAIKKQYTAVGRRMMNMGYGAGIAGSGVDLARQQGLQLGQASDLADAWAKGMQAKRSLSQNLLGYGMQAVQGAAAGQSASSQALAGTYGQQAAIQRQQSMMGDEQEKEGWQNAAQAIGGFTEYMGRQQKYNQQRQLQQEAASAFRNPYGGGQPGESAGGQVYGGSDVALIPMPSQSSGLSQASTNPMGYVFGNSGSSNTYSNAITTDLGK